MASHTGIMLLPNGVSEYMVLGGLSGMRYKEIIREKGSCMQALFPVTTAKCPDTTLRLLFPLILADKIVGFFRIFLWMVLAGWKRRDRSGSGRKNGNVTRKVLVDDIYYIEDSNRKIIVFMRDEEIIKANLGYISEDK